MSKAPETLTTDESERLLSTLRDTPVGDWSKWKRVRNYTMALLMLDSGLRVGEVVISKVAEIVMAGAPVTALNITGKRAKKNCERIIPTSERLQNAILEMWGTVWSVRPEFLTGYAFFEKDCRTHLTTRQVQRIIGSASLSSIGRAIHPHVLRHTFATRLMRVTSMATVQNLLGHKNLTSTQVYTHPNGDDCKKAIENMSIPPS